MRTAGNNDAIRSELRKPDKAVTGAYHSYLDGPRGGVKDDFDARTSGRDHDDEHQPNRSDGKALGGRGEANDRISVKSPVRDDDNKHQLYRASGQAAVARALKNDGREV